MPRLPSLRHGVVTAHTRYVTEGGYLHDRPSIPVRAKGDARSSLSRSCLGPWSLLCKVTAPDPLVAAILVITIPEDVSKMDTIEY
jgi:hypothetical protein